MASLKALRKITGKHANQNSNDLLQLLLNFIEKMVANTTIIGKVGYTVIPSSIQLLPCILIGCIKDNTAKQHHALENAKYQNTAQWLIFCDIFYQLDYQCTYLEVCFSPLAVKPKQVSSVGSNKSNIFTIWSSIHSIASLALFSPKLLSRCLKNFSRLHFSKAP